MGVRGVTYDFAERVQFSRGVDCHYGIRRHLMTSIPGAESIVPACRSDDRNGVDFWVNRRNGRPISIDFKHRSFDPIERFGADDICIETCSVYRGKPGPPFQDEGREAPGWTINSQKKTDLVVYTWPACGERRRYWIAFFPHLCAVSQRCYDNWIAEYGEKPTPNRNYTTLNIYVPCEIVEREIQALSKGFA